MFIPLYDNNPVTRTPVISYLILFLCIAVFVKQTSLTGGDENKMFLTFGIVPALLFGHETLPDGWAVIAPWMTIFSSMFLHGGWLHLIGNMVYLWIFSDNVEDAMGPVRFVIFYALCGVGAGMGQALMEPESVIPIIGASGGIAGILGAYIILHPHAQVRVAMFFGIFFRFISLPAWFVLGVWIGLQFISLPSSQEGEGGVAYFAHIGGFITGMFFIPMFKYGHVPLFAEDDTPDEPDNESWTHRSVSLSEVRKEAKQRYKSSVPTSRRKPGPWG